MTDSNTYSPAIQAILDSVVYPRSEATWGHVMPVLGDMSGVPNAVELHASIAERAAAELRSI